MIPISDDEIVEEEEHFFVQISTSDSRITLALSSLPVTIQDDDGQSMYCNYCLLHSVIMGETSA